MDRSEFDRFADEYEQLHAANVRWSGEAPEFFARSKIEVMARLLAPVQPKRVLDFGTGVGASLAPLRACFANAALTGVDVSERSLAIARQRHGEAAELVSFDGEMLPFASGQFDCALAACVFHHIAAAAQPGLLAQLRRVLLPGGRLFVFEHNPKNPLTRHAVNTCAFDANAVISGRVRSSRIATGTLDSRCRFSKTLLSFFEATATV